MRILMTGATGLIGRELGKALADRGDTLVCFVRDVRAARRQLPFPAVCRAWDHNRPVPAEALHAGDAVVNLAGEPVVDTRWTSAKKALIRDSRVQGTRQLVRAVLQHGPGVAAFVQGSASGYDGEPDDERLTASSAKGPGFLADVVQAWEAELRSLAEQRPRARPPVVRTGIVLAMFRLSAAGRQWTSWIHLDDIAGLFLHALDGAPSGILEGVAPQPATNRQFTTALCRSLGVIENLLVPSLAVRALFGERAAIVLGGTRLEPLTTQVSGFRFRFETVEPAPNDLLAPLRGGVHLRVSEQWLPHAAAELWPFLRDASNFEGITPPFLAFCVLGKSTPEIGAGTLIDCRLKLNGIPIAWQTRIETRDPLRRFIDLQAKGPYALWRHTHDFIPRAEGR